MTLRAADVKDEHGWQILSEKGEVVGHATSRDVARTFVKGPSEPSILEKVTMLVDLTIPIISADEPDENGNVQIQVLPADDSPEAVAGRAAFEVDQRIKRSIAVMKGAWVDLARDLYIFYTNKMWEAIGAETWRSYLADPDVGIDERQAYEWTAIYKQLVVDRNVDPDRLRELHYTKVAKTLPAVRRDQVTVDQALADVEALTKSDIEARYSGKFQPQKNQRGRPDTSSTIHTDSEPQWAKCPTCGSRYRIDPETGERVDP